MEYKTDFKQLFSIGANVTMDSKEIKRKLSGSEQLKEQFLKYRNPNIAPAPNVNVSVLVNVTGLKYNVFEAKLTTRLSLITVSTFTSFLTYNLLN